MENSGLKPNAAALLDEMRFADVVRTMSEYIDFDAVSSWSEIVLLAAVNGLPLNMDVVACTMYACLRNPNLAESFTCDISGDSKLWDLVGTTDFVGLLFKICDDGQSMFEWSSTRGYVPAGAKRVFKYKVLNAVFNHSPLPVVRYYAAHRIGLHGFDSAFISWFSKRISEISSGKYANLARVVMLEIKSQRELSKFTA